MTLVGLRVGDSTVGLASAPIADVVATLNKQLAPAKIEVALTAGRDAPDGVVSPLLEIRLPVPSGGTGEGAWQVLVGATSASVAAPMRSAVDGAAPPDGGSLPAPTPAVTETSVLVPEPAQAAADAQSVGTDLGPGTAVAGFETTVPSAEGAAPGTDPVGEAVMASPEPRRVVVPARGIRERFDVRPLYLLFGGLVVVGLVLNGLLGGVKRQWNS